MDQPIQRSMGQIMEQIQEQGARRQADREAGVPALRRLLNIARGHTGQSRVVAGFLLSLYNGTRFKLDPTDLRALDQELFDDCLAVLRMDSWAECEVHNHFQNGSQIWEQLATDWNVTDYTKRGRSV